MAQRLAGGRLHTTHHVTPSAVCAVRRHHLAQQLDGSKVRRQNRCQLVAGARAEVADFCLGALTGEARSESGGARERSGYEFRSGLP